MTFTIVRRSVRRKASVQLRQMLDEIPPLTSYGEGKREGVLLPETKEALERMARRNRRTNFCDLGPGEGNAIDAAEAIHPNIQGYGWAKHEPANPDHRKRWIQQPFEAAYSPNHFHVMQSRFGLHHARNHVLALENVLNSLRKNGELHIHRRELMFVPQYQVVTPEALERHADGTTEERAKLESLFKPLVWKQVFDTLRQQGFEVTKESEPHSGLERTENFFIYPTMLKIVRRTRKKADLSAFYGNKSINKHSVDLDASRGKG